jgi:hypothetical protein
MQASLALAHRAGEASAAVLEFVAITRRLDAATPPRDDAGAAAPASAGAARLIGPNGPGGPNGPNGLGGTSGPNGPNGPNGRSEPQRPLEHP